MTPEELEQRKPVWIAMSDLFLDTDVRIHFAFAALNLAGSRYTIEQLETIFTQEVAPALGGNLLVVAGEWAGFDSDWVVEQVRSSLGSLRPLRLFDIARGDWRALATLIVALRKLPVEERRRRVTLWECLSKVFLDRNPHITLEDATPELLDRVWRGEMWPSYGSLAADYHKHSPTRNPSPQEIEQAWTRFRNALS